MKLGGNKAYLLYINDVEELMGRGRADLGSPSAVGAESHYCNGNVDVHPVLRGSERIERHARPG